MNPYAQFLGDRDPLQVIAQTSDRLREYVDALGAEGANRAPAPGKWSVREIICHLADTEMVFAFRLRQALAEPFHVIQPFDQDHWAERYAAYTTAQALDLFRAVRAWNLALLAKVTAADMAKKLTHPERGDMTFRTVVETMGGHDTNHLQQIERIAGRAAGA